MASATPPPSFGPPSSATSSIGAAPATLPADGMAMSVLTIVAKDVSGHLLPNQAVSLGVSGSGNLLVPSSGTCLGGAFTATLASTVP